MFHHPVFYKLLGIPDGITEPSPYQLLGIAVQESSPEAIKTALAERKKLLRQNIPGPQFIPMVLLFEKELDRSARLLLDPARRKAYHARLAKEAQQVKQQRGAARRQKQVLAAREAIRDTVRPDGTLGDDQRPILDARLRGLGLSEKSIRTILAALPSPAPAAPPAGSPTPARDTDFFASAIDMAINQKLLLKDDEERLYELAGRLGIAREGAAEAISRRLASLQARRAESPEEALKARFAQQVRSMYPDRRASRDERERLRALAASQGLSADAAARVLDECLETVLALQGELRIAEGQLAAPAAPAAAPGAAPLAPGTPEPRPGGMFAPPPQPKRSISPMQLALFVGIPAGLILVAAIVLVVVLGVGRNGTSPKGAGASTALAAKGAEPHAGTATEPSPDPVDVLRRKLLAAINSPSELDTLLAEPEAAAALEPLADRVRPDESLENADAVALFCAALSSRAALDAPTQDRIVRALIRVVQETRKPAVAERPAQALVAALFLRTDDERVVSPGQRRSLAKRCTQAWQKSLKQAEADPLHDRERIVAAVADGGSLELYAGRAGSKAFGEVAARLAQMAADPKQRHAKAALAALDHLGRADKDAAPELARKTAHMALCDILRKTTDTGVATRVGVALVHGLGLADSGSIGADHLAIPERREAIAADFERFITSGGRPPRLPTEGAPAVIPKTQEVRAKFTTARDTASLLSDAALALLAGCERAARFTMGTDAWAGELVGALAAKDRAEHLAEPIAIVFAASGRTTREHRTSAIRLKQLQADVRSSSTPVRYAAIGELKHLEDPEATQVLLRAVSWNASVSSPAEARTLSRLLGALRSKQDKVIPGRLAHALGGASSLAGFAIMKTLKDCTDTSAFRTKIKLSSLEFPRKSTPAVRARCARQWQDILGSGLVPWKRDKQKGEKPKKPAKPDKEKDEKAPEPGAGLPDVATLKLLATAARHTELMASLMRARRWGKDNLATPSPTRVRQAARVVATTVGRDLRRAADACVDEARRLTRGHAKATTFAQALTRVDLERQARTLAAGTDLQKTAVSLDAMGSLLDILAQEFDPDGANQEALKAARQRHAEALAETTNVAAELRENAYHTLVIWDLVLKGQR